MKTVTTDKPFTVFSLEADRDYLLARLINFSGNGFASRAGYFAQQACEKYLKAFLVQESKGYLKTHNLIELATAASQFDQQFSDAGFLKKLKIFDDFREVGRYGGEASHDPYSKKEEGFVTAGVCVWEGSYIEMLDELASTIRAKLNFNSVGWTDSLIAIQQGDQKDFLVSTWKLPIPLIEVLVTRNGFYKPN